ncbi:MAG: MlaD family protein [Planctomycetota bacterium]|jgi:phospholipid/cholesterol/gamma-HCH transport system substrate-binding protein
MSEHARDFRVGLFTLVGIAVLGGLVLLYGEEPTWIMTTRYDLRILVDNPSGIGEGTPTFMQGVQVGRVSAIEFQNPDMPSKGAAVVVGISDEYDIPVGSEATVHPSFGFDKGAINIHPPLGTTMALPRGSSIIGVMKGALESIVPEEYITNLGEAVDQIKNMVEDVGRLAGKVSVVSDDLHDLLQMRRKEDVDDPAQDLPANLSTAVERIDELAKLMSQMIGEQGDLREMTANLRQTSQDLRDWSGKLDGRTEQLVTRADELAAKFVDTLGTMSQILDHAHVAMSAINDGDGAVGRLIHDKKLYEELVDTVSELKLMIADLRTLAVWMQTDSRLVPGNL